MSDLPDYYKHYESDVAAALLDQINGEGDKALKRLYGYVDNAMLNGNEITVPGLLAAFMVIGQAVANMHPGDVRIFLADKITEGEYEE